MLGTFVFWLIGTLGSLGGWLRSFKGPNGSQTYEARALLAMGFALASIVPCTVLGPSPAGVITLAALGFGNALVACLVTWERHPDSPAVFD